MEYDYSDLYDEEEEVTPAPGRRRGGPIRLPGEEYDLQQVPLQAALHRHRHRQVG